MRRHLTNAVCGAVDYVSYPVGMLLVAPIVLRRLGPSEYGLWMIATAIISVGGIIASGFCDASLQRVAHLRAAGDRDDIARTVRSIMGINIVLGLAMAILAWATAPWVAPHIAVSHLTPSRECLISIRVASVAILLRALETVGISTLRGFEQYRITVQISTFVRLLTLGAAALLALLGQRTISILVLTAACLFLGTCLQFRQVLRFAGSASLWPTFEPAETRILLGLGVFPWLQALGGVIFSQADRIVLGISLGALAVAPYALCVQFAQPVFGLTASALHFLFPYFSTYANDLSSAKLRRTLFAAFACNFLLVACGAAFLLLFGRWFIRIWAGPVVAHNSAGILTPIVAGSALMGLGVTGTYAMQALGLFRPVAWISLAGRAAMLLLMVELLHHFGVIGVAFSRIGYGVVALLVYLPLLSRLKEKRQETPRQAIPVGCELQEGWKL